MTAPSTRIRYSVVLALAGAALAACSSLPTISDLPKETAIVTGADTALDLATAPLEETHENQSAFRLVVQGTEAFVIRMQMARMAMRSLDVQVYIWHSDLTGAFFAQQLLEAADRGVHVRLLLDDIDARAKNESIAALAAHPRIEVRLFNPFASRSGTLRKVGEGIGSFGRLNRRMHNKTWIADNRIAIAGGRNVGDEYFGASDEANFVDADFAMIGPIVRDASASFDKYWNSPSAYPIERLDAKSVSDEKLMKLRETLATRTQSAQDSRYATALRSDDAIKRMTAGERSMEWSSVYRFVSDDPLKVTMKKRDAQRSQVGATLVPMMQAAKEQISILSPYFVPGETLTAAFGKVAASGKQVRILTNSLAANDVAAVHGGYSRYREELLAGGVQLWELKPIPNAHQTSASGSSAASLHSKGFAVDRHTLFVGSFNLDPRSTWLNCEQGILVDDPVLAAQLETLFSAQTSGERAWRVTLKDGRLSWSDGHEVLKSEPKASAGKSFQAWFARVFHLDAQL